MKIERYLQPIDLNWFMREFPSPKRNYIKGSNLYKPNGDKECARRVKQIAAQQLKLDNGLIYEPSSG